MKYKIAVTGKRKLWFLLSALFILPGLISLMVQGLNLGIDFKGGLLLQLQFEETVEVENVRNVLAQFDLEQSAIQSSESSNIIIRTQNLEDDQRQEVLAALEEKLGNYEIMRMQRVGAVISSELRNAAFLALFIAGLLMIAYITVRFEFKFAVAAVLALLYDVLVVIGVFSIFQIEVDSTFIAAILTIVGYSVNDTIVFFDRIRENLKGYRKGLVAPIVDASVNHVLLRAINTSVTTLFGIVALLFFGGETTKVFALALFLGVLVGTFSSVFIAPNIWALWRDCAEEKRLAAYGQTK
ncbi:MAG TPA: protein translocase subunit SecF [Firmicutes bacterium]|nr:protein translocase subunit SecF [Bacillota bacterium]